jgi:holo-[acyl-carrier protein] synthase
MILGIGADFCEIDRVREAIERGRGAFLHRLFTEQELSEVARHRECEVFLFAVGFAAKEAAAKALGTGITRWVGWHDFTIKLEQATLPMLEVSGGAQRKLHRLTPVGKTAVVHLATVIKGGYASAFVILEARCPILTPI